MLNCVLCYVLLSTVAGSVFSLTVPLPHQKPLGWEQPVVISEEFYPPHLPSHHQPRHLPQNEFKEIIGIELQRIPFHRGPEQEELQHGRHKEHEILEHRKHEILEHEPHQHGFSKARIPSEIIDERREHDILSHELPPHDLLEHEHEHEHDHLSHELHTILEHEHEHREHEHREHERKEHERREHEHREHEVMVHEDPHEHDILEHDHDHHEHDVAAHQIPHEPRHPPWEDPDFVLDEEEHHEEHEHEFHHEELFPEVSRRRTNRRRESGSRESGSRRNNSNSNRRENSNRNGNSNRRENSNRQGINNRRGNSNSENSRRNRGGSNINSEELFPRRNSQNNNRRNNNNNSNNRRNNNNREGARRNSNIEELAALEEEILQSPEISSDEISRPERDVGQHINNDRRETSYYESSLSKQSDSAFPTHVHSNIHSSGLPTNNFEKQSFVSESNTGRHHNNGNSRGFNNEHHEHSFGEQRRPTSSNINNQEYSNSGFPSSSNVNEYSFSSSGSRRPDQTSSNIFVNEEEYLTLDGSDFQQASSRPTGSNYNNNNNYNSNNNNNNGQSWNQEGLTGSSRPGQANAFGSNRPGDFSSGGSFQSSYLGSRPGSGKPLSPGSLFGQESSTFNRPGSSSSGLNPYEEERPNRPNSGSSGFNSHQGERPSKPNSGSSGLYSSHEERPGRPTTSSSGLHSHQGERPSRPNGGSSGLYSHQEERPSRPNSGSGSHLYQEERPSRPGGSFSGSHSHQEERPSRPSSGSGSHLHKEERPNRPGSSSQLGSYEEARPGRPSNSGSHSHQEERPSRPNSSSGLSSNQGNSKPNRPSSSQSGSQGHGFHEETSRPQRPSNNRPSDENSRPRPTNGNNLSNASDLISVQEDSWLWPGHSEDEDKKNRRVDSSGNKKPSGTTKRPSTSRPSTSSSNNKKQHANIKLLPTDSCGVDLANRIIGGENTQLDEFPWMALLQHSSSDGRALGFGCGGSLISPRYVLTAAHCIKGPAIGNNIKVTKVRLGEFDISSETDCQGEVCSPPPTDIAVEEIIVHPKYRATDRAQLNDIALIRLRENAKTGAYISPICLPLNNHKDHVGEKLVVAGWGKTSNGQKGASSKTKQKVSIPVVTLEECSPFYNRINIQLNNTQMCAGGERGKDSCQGDSGGPLMSSEVIDSQVRWQVHGIVSFGPEDCGIDNVAGVYTKVSEYIDWILDNMKK